MNNNSNNKTNYSHIIRILNLQVNIRVFLNKNVIHNLNFLQNIVWVNTIIWFSYNNQMICKASYNPEKPRKKPYIFRIFKFKNIDYKNILF